jgi:2,4-dienoyl-CoA reductase (NADPH2)
MKEKENHNDCTHDRCFSDIDLLSPLKIRGVNLRNRIVLSPMCQYSAIDGVAEDWHLVHLGSRAVGGAGLIFTEATAVTAQGRISGGDLGIWDDKHIDPLKRIVTFVKKMGAAVGIQLAHAGRKASCIPPWEGGKALTPAEGGWDVVAPSSLPFQEGSPIPKELDQNEIQEIIQSFVKGAQRALKAGFDVIEIHAAHGYLINEFLSPLTNKRIDQYGGSLENRTLFLCTIVNEIRAVIPSSMPLFVRISATDWVEDGWTIQDSVYLANVLQTLGVDLIDTSSGAVVPHAKIPIGAGYQIPLAVEIKKGSSILCGAVGLITDPDQANEVITSGSADLVFIGREFLREPYWALKAEQHLNQTPQWPIPYGYAVKKHK